MLESTRKKEEEVKKETSEQLDLFRKQQEEKDKELLEGGEEVDGKAGSPTVGESQSQFWTVNARKRKRAKENDRAGLKGLKLRKSSSTGEAPVGLKRPSSTGEALSVSRREVGHSESVEPQETTFGSASTEKASAEVFASPPPLPDAVTAKIPPKEGNSSNPKVPGTSGLGLAGYSSEDED